MRLNVYKPKWPEDMHSRDLQELAVVAVKLLFIFKKSWLSGEFPSDWKKGNTLPFIREKESLRKL